MPQIVFTYLNDIWMSFVPLFVAVDALGALPFILSITQEMAPAEFPRLMRYAMLTAFGVGLGFIAIGQLVLYLLGIQVSDFLIAGGLILLVLSIRHLLTGKWMELQPTLSKEIIGVVPIGTPLIVGPAVLTTLLLVSQQRLIGAVIIALVLNLLIAWLIFAQAKRLSRILREPGLRAASQIAALLLAAIAVMMIRNGIFQIV